MKHIKIKLMAILILLNTAICCIPCHCINAKNKTANTYMSYLKSVKNSLYAYKEDSIVLSLLVLFGLKECKDIYTARAFTNTIEGSSSPKEIEASGNGIAGMTNVGNSCYMNSVLQTLYRTDSFRNSILTADDTDLPKDSVVRALKKVFKSMDKCKDPGLLKNYFLTAILGHKLHQEDVIETLQKIVERCTAEVNAISLPMLSYERPISLIQNGASVANNTQLSMLTIGNDIPSNGREVIIPIARNYHEEIRLENGNILPVNRPLRTQITLNERFNLGEKEYELSCVVVHRGNSSSHGHYVSYSKIRNEWYRFNDSTVTKVSFDEAKQEMESSCTLITYKEIK